MREGIHYNLTNEQYHKLTDWVSKSMADRIAKAPALALIQVEETKAMIDGSRAHDYVLEPGKAEKTYYHLQADHKRTTKAGKAHEEQIAKTGLVPLKYEDHTVYTSIAKAVRENKFASALLDGAIIESSIFWTDPETSCKCKCRPDIWNKEYKVVADLKTTKDASEPGFAKAIANFRYHVQAAHYLNGVRSTTDEDYRFIIIAVEKTPPYLVAIYELSERAITRGQIEIEKNLQTFMECKKSGIWPGLPASENIHIIDMPGWAYYD